MAPHAPAQDMGDSQAGPQQGTPVAFLPSQALFCVWGCGPRPHHPLSLIRFRARGRGHTLLKITVIIPVNGVKWNLPPQGRPLI